MFILAACSIFLTMLWTSRTSVDSSSFFSIGLAIFWASNVAFFRISTMSRSPQQLMEEMLQNIIARVATMPQLFTIFETRATVELLQISGKSHQIINPVNLQHKYSHIDQMAPACHVAFKWVYPIYINLLYLPLDIYCSCYRQVADVHKWLPDLISCDLLRDYYAYYSHITSILIRGWYINVNLMKRLRCYVIKSMM